MAELAGEGNLHNWVADAAVLCPSFYRADVVHNPGRAEAWWARTSARVIGWLQSRRAAKRVDFVEAGE